jgi:hypothetical protein
MQSQVRGTGAGPLSINTRASISEGGACAAAVLVHNPNAETNTITRPLRMDAM